MTEKEFLERVSAIRCSATKALEFAKQHGAKFDPEPIELPPLEVAGSLTSDSFCQTVCAASLPGYPYGRALTGPEAKEVIRRCEAWKEIRALVDCIGDDDPETDRLRRMELLAILDGKEKIK